MMTTAVAVVAVVAVAAAEAAGTKTLAASAMAGVTDNNQPKLAAEEMSAETALAMVTTMRTARTKMVASTVVVSTAFLHDRQQSTKRGSGMNGCNVVDGDGNSEDENRRGEQ
jgi:hypothetical protein